MRSACGAGRRIRAAGARLTLWPIALLGILACGAGPSSHPGADVLLITVDTLRADRLGLLGYERPTTPGIDRFFASGRMYERAYSTAASTSPSVVSILTGLLPAEHRVRLLYQLVPADVRLVTDYLPPEYRKAAFVSNVVLTDQATGIAARFDHYDDFVDEPESARRVYERGARRNTDAALHWLAEGGAGARPLFLWIHYIDPHGPYRAPPEWPRSFRSDEPRPLEPRRVIPYMREPGVTDGGAYVAAYDEEIAWLDSQIARLLEGYAALRPIDQALVVFTADHGESMMEHEKWFRHGHQVYEEVMRVPLLLRGPGVAPGRSDRLAQGTDVAPTILRFVGVEPPPAMPDVDLRTGRGLGRDRLLPVEATYQTEQWRGVIGDGRKWMMHLVGRDRAVKQARSYDLARDPQELQPGPLAGRERGARLLEELRLADPDPSGVSETLRKGRAPSAPGLAPGVAPDVAPDVLERLKALGYAGQEEEGPEP